MKVAVTDEQGVFAFKGIPSGKIMLIVQTNQGRTLKEAIVNHGALSVDVIGGAAQ